MDIPKFFLLLLKTNICLIDKIFDLKALVIGYGSIGKRHVENLLKYTNAEILICTKRKDLKPRKRCKIVNSLKEGINENPDVAFITNVTRLHVPTAIKLAKAGIDLFIEKPLSNSMKQIKTLQKIVKEKKITVLIGCNLRFHECIVKIKKLLEKHSIGKIISARVEWGSYLPDWHPYEDYRYGYAARKELGGGIMFTSIHEIDYLYWFFGEVEEVVSFSGKYSDLKLNVDDLAAVLLKFNNNLIVELHLDHFQRPEFRNCKIIGTKGTIYWDSNSNTVKLFNPKKNQWIKQITIHNYNRNDMYVKELKHFLSCVSSKKETINDLKQGVKTLEISQAILNSSKRKKVIKI